MTLKLVYLTGSRADYGLMEQSLLSVAAHPDLSLEVLATGQQVSVEHGLTVRDVEASGLPVRRLAPVPMSGADGFEMGQSVALQMHAITAALQDMKPDVLLVLGDRGEMVAGALAAVFLGIPVAHFHGGERSGTIDDQLRQVITSLAHVHFPATIMAQDRLVKMGEAPDHIHRLGAPGLDAIRAFAPIEQNILRETLGLKTDRDVMLCIFHPVVQDAHLAAEQVGELLSAVSELDAEIIVLAPNSDAGSSQISETYAAAKQQFASDKTPATFHWVTHLTREMYLSVMGISKLLIGNSSSGIIEAASVRTAVVNVGDRQNGRERADCVFDCAPKIDDIRTAISNALAYDGAFENVYDAGGCAEQLPTILSEINWSRTILKKRYTY